MSHFTVFFPTEPKPDPGAPVFARLEGILRDQVREDSAITRHPLGTSVLVTGSAGQSPRFIQSERGWIVVMGLLFDARGEKAAVDPEELLERLCQDSTPDFNRYEGTFVLAAWDEQRRTGWVANDQGSSLNCYYGEHDGGLYVTTCALPLARALGLSLDPQGVCELYSRGMVLAPTSMFLGLRRLETGEHLRHRDGSCTVRRHWEPYRSQARFRNTDEASAALSSLARDRVHRYSADRQPVVVDLTGGYDSRVLVAAAHAAGTLSAITVDGPKTHSDVRIAKLVARAMDWPVEYFNTETFWDRPITPEMRSELVHRTNGELPFTAVYPHLLARPLLAERYSLHLSGTGGEFLRYVPWAHEFFGIGKRRKANVDKTLTYRLLQEGPPPNGLFVHDWYPGLFDRLRTKIETVFEIGRGTLTTQQLDAAYLWDMTSYSAYPSAVSSWLPTAAPLMSAGMLDASMSLPWRLRLTTGLMRSMTHKLAPRVAAVPTGYGGTAGPVRLSSLHNHAWQLVKQAHHLASKVARVHFRNIVPARLLTSRGGVPTRKPYITDEFRSFLRPEAMYSRGLYDYDGLGGLLAGSAEDWQPRENLILRIATVEQLCRELDFKPDSDFLRLT